MNYWNEAMRARDEIKDRQFSVRVRFQVELQKTISTRLKLKGIIHPADIIMQVTAEDILLAAETTTNIYPAKTLHRPTPNKNS